MAEAVKPVRPIGPDRYEKALAFAAIGLFVLVITALFNGRSAWDEVPKTVWLHVATVMVPLVLTPVLLLRRRGDRMHRVLGWFWAVPLFVSSIATFGIRGINDGALSFIHLFSALTLVMVPLLILAARSHRIARHRRSVRGLVTGALLTAGFFTLIPGRLLGHWLWG